MPDALVIEKDQIQALISALAAGGYQVMGPVLERQTIVYGPISDAAQLPVGYLDEQDGGHYRLSPSPEPSPLNRALFRYVLGPHSWKRFLFPPRQRLWRAVQDGTGFALESDAAEPPQYAFFGMRACELAAIAVQDQVFTKGAFADRGYQERRERAFLVAVNCTRAGSTCFCASLGTGPAVQEGFDLALTELLDGSGHRFLVQVGSERGAQLLQEVPQRPATMDELNAARTLVETAATTMGRRLRADAAALLERNQDHPHWQEVAARCLSCANCTLVCPTCFCSTVEDETALDGGSAERWRQWDSCFTTEFSYLHGGPVRHTGAARYRQWITHKLAWWHTQFGTSGCVGCGRCITWCPVGIDLTEEVAVLRATEQPTPAGDS